MSFLQDIGSFFANTFGNGAGGANWGNILKAGELGLTGAGLAGNISAEKQRSDILSQLNNPNLLGRQATQLAGNVNPALVQAINNQVGGTLAEEGLSQSPGITASTTAGAIAPYEQQLYSQALSSIMQSKEAELGGLPGSVNLAPLLALLGKSGGAGGSGSGGAFSGFTPEQWAAVMGGNGGGTPQFPTSNPADLGGGDISTGDFDF